MDRQTVDIYDARAREYADKFTSLKADKHLTAFLAGLPDKARVLDLGCGPGNAARMMSEAGHTVDAWDASAEMVALAARADKVTARQATFSDLDADTYYDGIWANFSLLHAARADMDTHLAAIAKALKPGGLFHIGMKTGEGAERDGLGRAYTFYSESDLQDRLARAGLSVFSQSRGADEGLAGTVDPWVIFQARKNG